MAAGVPQIADSSKRSGNTEQIDGDLNDGIKEESGKRVPGGGGGGDIATRLNVANLVHAIEKDAPVVELKTLDYCDYSKVNPLILPPGLDCNTLARLLIEVIGRKAIQVTHEADRLCLLRASKILLSSSTPDHDDDDDEDQFPSQKKFRKNSSTNESQLNEPHRNSSDLNSTTNPNHETGIITNKLEFSNSQLSSKSRYEVHPSSAKSGVANESCVESGCKGNPDSADTIQKPTFHGRTLLKGPGIPPRIIPHERSSKSEVVDPRLALKDYLKIRTMNVASPAKIKVETEKEEISSEKSDCSLSNAKDLPPPNESDNNINNKKLEPPKELKEEPFLKGDKIPVISTLRTKKKRRFEDFPSSHLEYENEDMFSLTISGCLSEYEYDKIYPVPMDSKSDEESESSNSSRLIICESPEASSGKAKPPEEEFLPPLPPEETHPDRFRPPLPPPEDEPPSPEKRPNVVGEEPNLAAYNNNNNNNNAQWLAAAVEPALQPMGQSYNYNQFYNWSAQNSFVSNNVCNGNVVFSQQQSVPAQLYVPNLPQSSAYNTNWINPWAACNNNNNHNNHQFPIQRNY